MITKEVNKTSIKKLSHEEKIDHAYNGGYKDALNHYVYRFTKLPCICKACRESYRIGWNNGRIAAAAKDD